MAWSLVTFMDIIRNSSDLGNVLEQSKKVQWSVRRDKEMVVSLMR